jgi:hypothetical protein
LWKPTNALAATLRSTNGVNRLSEPGNTGGSEVTAGLAATAVPNNRTVIPQQATTPLSTVA